MLTELTKSIIVVTWDGKTAPLSHLFIDANQAFDILLYDYSGVATKPIIDGVQVNHFISIKSECKGDVITNVYEYLKGASYPSDAYIGLLDDDLCISFNDINKLLFIARLEQLDVFQPSLTLDSHYHHRQFVNKAGVQIQKTWWVEIMGPFYSLEVFMAVGPYLKHSISGTGVDVYLVPTIQRLIDKNNTAVVHAVQMKHCRPIRTDFRIFSNGKDNLTEINELQNFSKQLAASAPEKFDATFMDAVLNRKYVHAIPLQYKLKRIPTLLKNLYSFIVDASYR
jgi:hypothetical protein